MIEVSRPAQPIEVFFSYAHEDEELRCRLDKHLSALERKGFIAGWHDRKIGPGQEWAGQIDEHINSAGIILLLVSADFLASDYCYGIEMSRALERHHAGAARVIPIILRPVDWSIAPFSKLQMLPSDAKPVINWDNPDNAFADIARGIRETVTDIIERHTASAPLKSITQEGVSVFSAPADVNSLRRTSRPKHGELLPYLCDRSSQETALDGALQHHRQNMPRRPFLCFVHGDERECHDMFERRLKEILLPDLLGFKGARRSLEYYLLFRPPSSLNHADLPKVLRRSIAARIVDNRDASIDDIVQVLAQHKSAAIVSLHLNYDDWIKTGPNLINAYLKFWQDFPDMPSGRIFICIFFTYKAIDDLGLVKGLWHRAGNNSVRDYFKQLASVTHDRIHCVVLPELCAISLGEAEDWVRDVKNFRGLCDVHGPHFCNLHKGMERLREIYARSKPSTLKGGLPMQFLADELSKLLSDYSCR